MVKMGNGQIDRKRILMRAMAINPCYPLSEQDLLEGLEKCSKANRRLAYRRPPREI